MLCVASVFFAMLAKYLFLGTLRDVEMEVTGWQSVDRELIGMM